MGKFERISVDVPIQTADAMRQAVADGGYESAGQLVTYALREWFAIHSSEERKLELLRAAIKEGEESGPGIPADQVFAEIRAMIASYEKPSEAA